MCLTIAHHRGGLSPNSQKNNFQSIYVLYIQLASIVGNGGGHSGWMWEPFGLFKWFLIMKGQGGAGGFLRDEFQGCILECAFLRWGKLWLLVYSLRGDIKEGWWMNERS
jgi:hypothetical protein